MFEIIIFSFKKKLLLFLVLSSLLAAEITSSKYLGDSVFKIFKSNKIHHAVYCLREIQNVIHDKNSLCLSKCLYYSSCYCQCGIVINGFQFLMKGHVICLIKDNISISLWSNLTVLLTLLNTFCACSLKSSFESRNICK